jgi:hypothetical protein
MLVHHGDGIQKVIILYLNRYIELRRMAFRLEGIFSQPCRNILVLYRVALHSRTLKDNVHFFNIYLTKDELVVQKVWLELHPFD